MALQFRRQSLTGGSPNQREVVIYNDVADQIIDRDDQLFEFINTSPYVNVSNNIPGSTSPRQYLLTPVGTDSVVIKLAGVHWQSTQSGIAHLVLDSDILMPYVSNDIQTYGGNNLANFVPSTDHGGFIRRKAYPLLYRNPYIFDFQRSNNAWSNTQGNIMSGWDNITSTTTAIATQASNITTALLGPNQYYYTEFGSLIHDFAPGEVYSGNTNAQRQDNDFMRFGTKTTTQPDLVSMFKRSTGTGSVSGRRVFDHNYFKTAEIDIYVEDPTTTSNHQAQYAPDAITDYLYGRETIRRMPKVNVLNSDFSLFTYEWFPQREDSAAFLVQPGMELDNQQSQTIAFRNISTSM